MNIFWNVSGFKFQKSLILALSLFGIHCITDNNTALLAHQNTVLFHSLAHSVLLFQHFFVVDLIYVSWRSKLHMEEQCCLLACFDHAKKTNEQPFSNKMEFNFHWSKFLEQKILRQWNTKSGRVGARQLLTNSRREKFSFTKIIFYVILLSRRKLKV